MPFSGRMRKLCLVLALFFFSFFLSWVSCDSYQALSDERAEKARDPNGDIVIGVVDSSTSPTLFVQGVRLAVHTLNDRGGILGRPVKALFYDDENSLEKGREIARKLAQNSEVVAVVGHRSSDVAVPVSVTYEKTGLLFMSHGAAAPELTQYNGAFTFRNIPSDEAAGRELAAFAKRGGYEKIAIVFDRDSPANRLTEIFHKAADDVGIDIVAEKSYSSWETDFRAMIADIMKAHTFDCVFLGGIFPAAGLIIRQMREMGLDAPVLGSDSLDSSQLWETAGKAADGTIVFTVFDPSLSETPTRNFVRAFKARYGIPPDTWAAQGYDAVQSVAAGIEKSGSAEPRVAANAIRFSGDRNGVVGPYHRDWDGGISGKTFFFKKVENGEFKFLERDLNRKINFFDVSEETTLRLPIQSDFTVIDPGLARDRGSVEIIEQLFVPLVGLDPATNETIPELARDWTVSPDGKIFTFRMRPDALWSDGKPLTAHDVQWTLRRNIDPKTGAPYPHSLYVLKNARAIQKGWISDVSKIGVRAIDDLTVEFSLEKATPHFPAMLSLPPYRPLPRQAVETHKGRWTDPGHIQVSGPYQLTARKKGQVTILRKNRKYYDADSVLIPGIRYYVTPEGSVGLSMYQDDQLDVMGGDYLPVPVDALSRIRASRDLAGQYSRTSGMGVYAYAFNVKKTPVDRPLVRKAIAACVDRDLLINLAAKGGHAPARMFTPPGLLSKEAAGKTPCAEFNPVNGKKWLARAGYPGGKGFPELTLFHGASEPDAKIARALQASLKHYLNIRVRLVERPWGDDAKPTLSKDVPHLFQLEWRADYPRPQAALEECFDPVNSFNPSGWVHPGFADLLERAGEASDQRDMDGILIEAETILCRKECVAVPIYFETAHHLVNPRVEGWRPSLMGGQRIRDWSLKK
ncbi:conserved hypothetical protein [Candidatus Desulfarcum epimagneticum]|uniref:Uncharacterized protein n=1 Tax=uncultured Desulfobacteraceae bacterium TaxID=218296 RepID=A0A484HJG5_9BACT|nr:conserved hypothetical protein [uncultured Desulfobacteraceae bacterium]